MNKNIRYISLIFILILIISLFTACQSKDEEAYTDTGEIVKYELEPDYGGKITLPLTNTSSLNPLMVENSYYYQFSKLIFEPLFEFEDDLSVSPKLVEDYSISGDGQSIKIRLKENILWHDGSLLTSSDVAFTIDTIKNLGIENTYGKIWNEALGVYGQIDINKLIRYEIIDNLNLNIILDKPYSNKLEILTFPIISKNAFEGNINKAATKENYIPIGTGPFKYKSYDNFKSLSLTSNDKYWKGKPYIDEIIGKVFDDENLVQIGFETGQINMSPAVGVDWLKYKEKDNIKVIEYISSEYEFLGFNFDREKFHGEPGKNLRKALNYGIDRQGIIEKVYLGHGVQVDVPTHPNSYLMSEEAVKYGYNKDRAIEILKELGYTEVNAAGLLVNGNNETLNIKILTNRSNVLRERTAELIVENLKAVGINASLDELKEFEGQTDEQRDREEWEYINQRIGEGTYEVILTGWNFSPIQEFTPLFHSNGIASKNNFLKFSSPTMDEILEKNYTSITVEERIEDNRELESYIVENLPYVSLFYRNNGLLLDKSIKGDLTPKFAYLYSGLEEAYINTKDKK